MFGIAAPLEPACIAGPGCELVVWKVFKKLLRFEDGSAKDREEPHSNK